LSNLYRTLRTTGGVEAMVARLDAMIKARGIDFKKSITADDIIQLANVFGVFAPITEWLPGPGEYVQRINRIVAVPAGEERTIPFCGPIRTRKDWPVARLTKYKEFTVNPTNRTAEDSVRLAFETPAAHFKPWTELIASSGPCDTMGIFDTLENWWLPAGVSATLTIINTDANSEARVQVLGKSWDTV
jgi:hypothetical protein